MDIIKVIENRHSVRTFNPDVPLTAQQTEVIKTAMEAATCPLPGAWSMELQKFEIKGPQRPGTYGVINGASSYMLLGFDAGGASNATAAGFAMEQVVLACTKMGLGTCWMAGTFKNADFNVSTHFPAGMSLQVVIPVGVSAKRRRLLERVTRFTAGSNNRKPMEKLFFVERPDNPMSDASQFYEPLMMMRLAPSSLNSQPWRAIIVGETVHFYCKDVTKSHLIDMGIGMCHFDETERYRGHTGTWAVDSSKAPDPDRSLTYIASYTRD